jgi:hypothetical protein
VPNINFAVAMPARLLNVIQAADNIGSDAQQIAPSPPAVTGFGYGRPDGHCALVASEGCLGLRSHVHVGHNGDGHENEYAVPAA